jgi:hypothetical protein
MKDVMFHASVVAMYWVIKGGQSCPPNPPHGNTHLRSEDYKSRGQHTQGWEFGEGEEGCARAAPGITKHAPERPWCYDKPQLRTGSRNLFVLQPIRDTASQGGEDHIYIYILSGCCAERRGNMSWLRLVSNPEGGTSSVPIPKIVGKNQTGGLGTSPCGATEAWKKGRATKRNLSTSGVNPRQQCPHDEGLWEGT